jgi:uncharacterized protein (UPF0128 family)
MARMATAMADPPVEAVRVTVGQFLLAAEEVHEGTRFRIKGEVYEVVSKPQVIGTQKYSARVRLPAGRGVIGAWLQVGKRVG